MRSSRLGIALGALIALGVTALGAIAFVVLLSGDPGAVIVNDEAATPGSITLEYQGIRVDVPPDWRRLDTGDCEFTFERWGPPETAPCDPDVPGVAFYGAATFDPAVGPGVRRQRTDAGRQFAGYVVVGDWAVYVVTPDRAVSTSVLDSARVAPRI